MLNPFLLLFLPLALVPIGLHLITLYRTRTVELSTFRFLMDSYVRQRQRIRLLEYLVMLLRFLFVLLIVLALSRPVIERFGWLFAGQSGKDITLIMDTSGTMNAQTGGQSSLQRAQSAAMTVLDQLSASDHVTIINATEQPHIVVQAYAGQRDALTSAIQSLEATASNARLGSALQKMLDHPPRGPRSVYVFTDGQAQTFSSLTQNQVLTAVDPKTQVVLINVGPTEAIHNAGLIGQPPKALRPVVGLPVNLTTTIINNHETDAVTLPLTVTIDDQQIHQVTLDIEPGETIEHNFSYTPKRQGMITGRFELPRDRFPDDDQYHFVLNVQPRMTVTLVTDQPLTQGIPDDFYVRAALKSPLAVEPGQLEDEKELARAIQIQSINKSGLTREMIQASDVIALLNVNMTDSLAQLLKPFVLEGGGLIILPGDRSNAEGYQQRFFDPLAQASGTSYRVLIDSAQGDPDDESGFQSIIDVDQTHPVFQVFSTSDDVDEPHFTQSRLFRYFPLTIEAMANPDLAVSANRNDQRPEALLRMSNDHEALIDVPMGQGRMMVAAFGPTPAWSNVPLQSEFVPMLLRAMMYLRPQAVVEISAAVDPGKPATLAVADRWRDPQVVVRLPDNQLELMDLHREGRRMVGAWLDTDQRGVYQFDVTAQSPEGPVSQTYATAVNLASDQSQTRFLDQSAMVSSFAPLLPVYLQTTAQDTQLSEHLSQREEIWRYLVWVVFLIIGIEFLIATLRVSVADLPTAVTRPNRPSRWRQALDTLGLLESIKGKQQFRREESQS